MNLVRQLQVQLAAVVATVGQLERALAALTTGVTAAPPPPAAPSGPPASRPAVKPERVANLAGKKVRDPKGIAPPPQRRKASGARTPREIAKIADLALAELRREDGRTVREIAAALGDAGNPIETLALGSPLRLLKRRGVVTTTGIKVHMKYHLAGRGAVVAEAAE